jgi:ELWxxDGT repeat protein
LARNQVSMDKINFFTKLLILKLLSDMGGIKYYFKFLLYGLCLGLFFLYSLSVSAQHLTPTLINLTNPRGLTNINTNITGSPTPFIYEHIYFFGGDGGRGTEPRTTRVSPTITYLNGGQSVFVGLMNDIASGSSSSIQNTDTAYFAELNNTAYFFARNPTSGLYRITRNLSSVAPFLVHPFSSTFTLPRYLVRAGNQLFFAAGRVNSGVENEELWSCSGSIGSESTTPLTEINPSASSFPRDLTPVDIGGVPHLFFTAINTGSNRELWARNVSTGTMAMVSEINPSLSVGSNPANLIAYGGFCYFSANDGSGIGLWRSNGTTNTKISLPVGTTVDNTVKFAVANGLLFFVATNAANGKELWKFDGTTASVIDVLSGSASSNPKNLTSVSTFVYFSADASGSGDIELFRSNGTGSELAGANLYGSSPADPIYLGNVNGTLYYFVRFSSASTRYSLYRHSPGTNTSSLFWDGPTATGFIFNPLFGAQITEVNNDFYFAANPGSSGDPSLYYAKFDNTVIIPCAYTSVSLSYPSGLCVGSGTANPIVDFTPDPDPSNICPSGNCFSSTAGLSINPATGAIDLAASTAGTYTITYNYVTSSPACNLSTTANVTIAAGVSATIEVNTTTGTGTQGNTNSTLANSTFRFGTLPSAPIGSIPDDANISLAVSPDGNKIYIADEQNHCIRVADLAANTVTTLAGNATVFGFADGIGTAARFRNPTGIATDIFGVIYVADKGNHVIRKIDPNTLQVTTIAGVSGTISGGDSDNADPLLAEFSQPTDLVVTPEGIIYVSDKNNHKIKRITSTGVSTFAGPLFSEAIKQGFVDASGTAARFNYPGGLDIDGSGNIYVADRLNHRIRRITSTGAVSTYAGGGASGVKTQEDVDGTLLNARFFYPVDVAYSATGEIYVADRSNHKIKVIRGNNVSNYAGSGTGGFANGFASVAQFNFPVGVVADVFNNVYLIDKNNQRVRRVFINNPAGNIAGGTTVCGTSNSGTLTLSGAAGSVIRWESSINNGQTWSPIVNATTTLNYTNVSQTTIYRAIVSVGACGQAPSNTAAILVSTPQAPTVSATTVCGTSPATNVSVTLSAQGAFDGDYRWYDATNTLILGQTNSDLTVSVSSSTTYKVSIRKNNCESTLTTVVATVNPAPNPTITGSINTCQSSTSTYSVTNVSGNTYNWVVTGGIIQSGQNTNSITVSWGTGASGTIQVTETTTSTTCATTRLQNITLNPLPNPVVSGNNTVCVSPTNQTYSVPVVAGNTYLWSVPAGGTIVGSATGSSVNVQWNAAGARQVLVNQTVTASTCSRQVTYNVTVNPLPTPSITGGNSVCRNSTQNYSVTNVSGNTYNWVVTNGTIQSGQGSNAISVLWSNTASGIVQVTETITATTCSQVANLNITLNAAPAPTISGLATVCTSPTINRTYSVAVASGNTFAWTVSSGGAIQSGQGSNSITVRWTTAGNENVSLIQTNASGCATTLNYPVLVNQSPSPSITGNNSVCRSSSQTYSVVNNAGNTYSWTASGGTIASGQGTNQITVNWGTGTVGTVNVTETVTATTCATLTTLNITLNPLPTPVITGTNLPCSASQQTYSVMNNVGNTYNWVITGGTINAGQGTNQITVDWGAAGAGNVQVTETSTAGCVTIANRPVTIRPLPNPVISGNATVCVSATNQAYSIGAVTGTSYSWAVTNGTISGSSTANIVNVQWTTAGSGRLIITQTINSTGCLNRDTLDVTINPLPTPSITGNATVCANSVGQTYSTASSGNTFNWIVTGGTITAGQGTNQISVTWGASGAGNVQLRETIPASGCNVTVNQVITINAIPNPTIIGLSAVCENASQIYSVNPSGNQFNWIVTGGTITNGQGTNQITVDWGASGAGNVQITETINATSCNRTVNQTITINPLPNPSISGSQTVCAGTVGQIYSVFNSGNTFNWIVTGGTITAGQGSNQITVTWGASGAGNVQITETIGGTGCNRTVNQAITINSIPTPVITGSNSVCANSSQNYSVANSGNTFNWIVTGGTITAGQGTNQITVTWGASGAGNVQLTETIGATTCNTTVNQVITINPLPIPTISGLNTVCENASQIYSVANSGNTFNWIVTSGTITAGQGTNQITVTWGASGAGNVQLTETIGATTCNTTVNQTVTINPIPNPTITGNAVVCANASNQTYSVANSGNTFNWVVTGGTITNGQGTNQITVTWGASGAGNVQLTETIGTTSCNRVVNQVITINPIPNPTITGSANACANVIGQVYSVANINGNTYNWTVTGGTITAGQGTHQITITWGSAGAASLQVEESIPNGCSTTSALFNVTINPLPSPTITGGATVCANSTNQIYSVANSGNNFSWIITGGTITAGQSTNQITVNWGGGPTGTVQVTETIGATTCSAQNSLSINIIQSPNTNITGTFTACAGSTLTYTAATAPNGQTYTYNWLVMGGTITNQTNNQVTIQWDNTVSGVENVRVNIKVDGTACEATTPLPGGAGDMGFVTLSSLPAPSIGGSNTVCAGSQQIYSVANVPNHNYTWTVTGGTIDNGQSSNQITVTWGSGTGGIIKLKQVNNSTSCEFTTPDFAVSINPSPGLPTAQDRFRCGGAGNVTLTATEASATNFNWYNVASGGSAIGTGASFITNVSTSPISFWVAAVNAGNCEGPREEVVVTIDPPNSTVQVASTLANADSCIVGGGDSPSGKITLALTGNNGPYTFNWSKVGVPSFSATTQNLSGITQGTYNVQITDIGGCITNAGLFVIQETLKGVTEVVVSEDVTIARGSSVTLNAQAKDAQTFEWFDANNTSLGTGASFTVTPQQTTTTYRVRITNDRNCFVDETVTVTLEDLNIFIPNVFSPNNLGDAKNELFRVYGNGIKSVNLKVFNRLNEVVYETTEWVEGTNFSSLIGWDGTYKGKPLENGTYVWSLNGKFINDTDILVNGKNTGTIILIR